MIHRRCSQPIPNQFIEVEMAGRHDSVMAHLMTLTDPTNGTRPVIRSVSSGLHASSLPFPMVQLIRIPVNSLMMHPRRCGDYRILVFVTDDDDDDEGVTMRSSHSSSSMAMKPPFRKLHFPIKSSTRTTMFSSPILRMHSGPLMKDGDLTYSAPFQWRTIA